MLSRINRLTSSAGFRQVVRDGRRAGTRSLVVHLRLDEGDAVEATGLAGPPTVGFVVSRAVGNAVARNRVKRRLRHLCAERLDILPAGSALVVRAQPAAAEASSASLGADLEKTLSRVTR